MQEMNLLPAELENYKDIYFISFVLPRSQKETAEETMFVFFSPVLFYREKDPSSCSDVEEAAALFLFFVSRFP